MRRAALYEAWTVEDVWTLIRRSGARTLVFDVEPLVAVWATDIAALDSGVAETLRRVGESCGAVAEAKVAGAVVAETLAAEAEAETETGPETGPEPEADGDAPARVPEVVLFATNSDRLPTTVPALAGVRVGYRASASKPLRIKGYRDLPRPGLVIGDQIATDGALAWRLGFDFVFYRPERDRIPFRPRLLHLIGRGLRPLLFRLP
jgi:hypothetical protein